MKKSKMEMFKEERAKGRNVFADASVEGRTYAQLETMENSLRQYRDVILMTRAGIGIGLFLLAFLMFTVSLVIKGFTGFTFGILAVALIIALLTAIDVIRAVLISNHILDRIAKERDTRVKEILKQGGTTDE